MHLRTVCRAKITKKALHYEGSIGIDKDLMQAADIYPNEMVQVLNVENGNRFQTYVIEEKSGSGAISLYGPAAHLGNEGELVVIISYSIVSEEKARSIKPKVVYVDGRNKIKK